MGECDRESMPGKPRVLALALALGLFACALVPAVAPAAWLPPQTVSGSSSSPVEVGEPEVVASAEEEDIAAWTQKGGAPESVMAAVRSPQGAWQSPVALSARGATESSAREPQLAVSPTGEAVAVWSALEGSAWLVEASFRAPGGAWSAPVQVSPVAGNEPLSPHVAIDSSGEAVVTWRGGESIYAATAQRGGEAHASIVSEVAETIFGGERTVEAGGIIRAPATPPVVTVDGAGEAVLLWRGGSTGHSLESAIRPYPGAGWSERHELWFAKATQAGGFQAVASDESGEALAAWDETGDEDVGRTLARWPAGGPWRSEHGAGCSYPYAAFDQFADLQLQVSMDEAGDALVVWESSAPHGYRSVVAQTYSAGGPVAAECVQPNSTGEASDPQAAMSARGDAIAAWRSYVLGNPGHFEAALRPSAAGAWQAPVQLAPAEAPSPSGAEGPVTAIGPQGGAVVLWEAPGRAALEATAYKPELPPPNTNRPQGRRVGAGPTITAARLTNWRFRVGRPRHARSTAHAPAGTEILFTLSRSARFTAAIWRRLPRLTVRNCRRSAARHHRARRCPVYSLAGDLTRSREPGGADRLAFSGRIGGHALEPGVYRMVLSASDRAGRSAPVTLAFGVVR